MPFDSREYAVRFRPIQSVGGGHGGFFFLNRICLTVTNSIILNINNLKLIRTDLVPPQSTRVWLRQTKSRGALATVVCSAMPYVWKHSDHAMLGLL